MEILKELEEKIEKLIEKYNETKREVEELKEKLKSTENPKWKEEKEILVKKLEDILKKLEKAI